MARPFLDKWLSDRPRFSLGLICVASGMLGLSLIPDYALYPWWILVLSGALFLYVSVAHYFLSPVSRRLNVSARMVLCLADCSLSLPFAFFLYTVAVGMGVFGVPSFFERKALSRGQMIVVQESLYAIDAQFHEVKRERKENPKSVFADTRNSLLFQLRSVNAILSSPEARAIFHEMEGRLQAMPFPENVQNRDAAVGAIREDLRRLDEKMQKAENRIKFRWKISGRSLSKGIDALAALSLDMPEIVQRGPLPVPEIYAEEGKLIILWKAEDKPWQCSLRLDQTIDGVPLERHHSLQIVPEGEAYRFHLRRYPYVEGTYLEEGLKTKGEIAIKPIPAGRLSWGTRYRTFFARISLLGSSGGIRHQDIFLRIVTALTTTYFRGSVPVILLSMFFLASLPVLELLERKIFGMVRLIRFFFTLLEHTTSIPIYVVIGIVFIGMYDGKNFTVLFLIVAYFLLPGLYKRVLAQVERYKKSYLGAKRALGMSEGMIVRHFVFRECRLLYLVYMLYFCSTMVLFETSFAYLKGGSPSELSLGIFLYHSRHAWGMGTFGTIAILVSLIYMFCRFARYFERQAVC